MKINPILKTKFTPNIPDFDEEKLNMSVKEFKNSDAYKKYVVPTLQTKKKQKQKRIKTWTKNHIFDIFQAFATIAALIISIIALLK